MPMVRVSTNLPRGGIPEGFEVRLTDLLAESMGKPRSRILVEVVEGARMVHGGSGEPVVNISVRSIGALAADDTVRHTERMSKMCREEMKLPNDKIIIEFYDLSPNHVGFNGTTVAAASRL